MQLSSDHSQYLLPCLSQPKLCRAAKQTGADSICAQLGYGSRVLTAASAAAAVAKASTAAAVKATAATAAAAAASPAAKSSAAAAAAAARRAGRCVHVHLQVAARTLCAVQLSCCCLQTRSNSSAS